MVIFVILIMQPMEMEMDMEKGFYRNCGMRLTRVISGINVDGSLNGDYCIACYRDGKFAQNGQVIDDRSMSDSMK